MCPESCYVVSYLKKGKLLLLFIDSGNKIDQHYYIKHVQQDHLLQHAHTCMEKNIFVCNKTLRYLINQRVLKSS
jgi:hypothetical protein